MTDQVQKGATGTENQVTAISVSAYASRIGAALRAVGPAFVEGEVQEPRGPAGSVLFFKLTDGESSIGCKVFRRERDGLEHHPSAGDLVVVEIERPDFYDKRGSLDLIVRNIRLAGEGELLRRRAELIERLDREGLCDPASWKPLCPFPRAVGVISGSASDARADVVQAVSDRFSPAHIICCDAIVQGTGAPASVIAAIAALQAQSDVDVIIIARGGGSVQDLVAFDDEGLCRAITACSKPIITAIGHTRNTPVCNHITHSAFTPSRSAELAVSSKLALEHRIEVSKRDLMQIRAQIDLRAESTSTLRRAIRIEPRLEAIKHSVAELNRGIAMKRAGYFPEFHSRLVVLRSKIAAAPRESTAAIESYETRLSFLRAALSSDRVSRELHSEIVEATRRVRDGISRGSVDHARDFGNAIARLKFELRSGIDADFARHVAEIRTASETLRHGIDRRLSSAREQSKHAAELIAARDFRASGYALVTNEAGNPVTTVSEARAGERLKLSVRDGEISARVEATTEREE